MKYLATFDGASASELSGVKAAAVKGCIGAVKAPIVSFTEQVFEAFFVARQIVCALFAISDSKIRPTLAFRQPLSSAVLELRNG